MIFPYTAKPNFVRKIINVDGPKIDSLSLKTYKIALTRFLL